MFVKTKELNEVYRELGELRTRIVKLEKASKPVKLGRPYGSKVIEKALTFQPRKSLITFHTAPTHKHTLKPYYSRKRCTDCGHVTRKYTKRSK